MCIDVRVGSLVSVYAFLGLGLSALVEIPRLSLMTILCTSKKWAHDMVVLTLRKLESQEDVQ